jgi:hypothetical protein
MTFLREFRAKHYLSPTTKADGQERPFSRTKRLLALNATMHDVGAQVFLDGVRDVFTGRHRFNVQLMGGGVDHVY